MKKVFFLLSLMCIVGGIHANPSVLVDDFNDTTLAEYTQSFMLEQDATNATTFASPSGALQMTRSAGTNAEQVLLLRDDYSLGIGQVLRVDMTTPTAVSYNCDFGIAISASVDPVDVVWSSGTADARHDYLYMYVKVGSSGWGAIGFNGTTQVTNSGYVTNQADFANLTGLYIKRTADTVFEVGYTTAAGDTLFRTLTVASLGGSYNAIGIYGDLRSVVTYGDFDNLRIESLPYNPTVTQVSKAGYVEATLGWNAPANENVVNQCVFAAGSDDPNLYYVGATDVDPAAAEASQFVMSANYDAAYNWAVVGIMSGKEQTFTTSSTLADVDPNNIVGPTWTFDSLPSTPAISTQPASVSIYPTETTTIAVIFSSITDATAVWKKYVDGTNDVTISNGGCYAVDLSKDGTIYTATLTITNPTSAEEGQYYCNLTNTGVPGTVIPSDTVNFGVKRLMAYWTLNNDATGWDGTYYLDSSGEGYNADPNGTPSFVAGADDAANGAVTINTTSGYAKAGTWNPSAYTGQFTVSLWAKWAGQGTATTWQGLISKEESYGADTMMWQLEMTSAATANSRLMLKNGLETGNLTSAVLPVDAWEHVALVWDGTTATIYRNGAAAVSGAWTPGTKTDATVNLGISAWSTTQNLMFNGSLDDIQVYSYALSEEAVADLYYAVTQKPVCINDYASDYDKDGNCIVDLADFASFAAKWMDCGLYPVDECPGN